MGTRHQVARAATYWGDDRRLEFYGRGGLVWTDVPAVRQRLDRLISGDPERDWIDHLRRTHLAGRAPLARALSLCCGDGRVERELITRGVVRECEGVDAAPGALERARALADEAGVGGVSYRLCDVNQLEAEEGAYDLVVAHQALHHIEALEHVARACRKALRPGGLMVAHEYVGPNRFASTPRHIEVLNAALLLLPERLRASVSWQRSSRVGPGARRTPLQWAQKAWLKLAHGELWAALAHRRELARLRSTGQAYIKSEIRPIIGDELAADDPTEAIRSADILGVLGSEFEFLQLVPLRGALLHRVLDDIAANFAPDDLEAVEMLGMLFDIEDRLTSVGELESHFAFVVARPRG